MKIGKREFSIKKKSYKGSDYGMKLSSIFSNDISFSKQTFFDLYKKNSDIRQCVKKIAGSVARNGLYLQDNQRQIIDKQDITDEVYSMFKTPTFAKFKIDFFRNYLISGEVYIIPVRNMYGDVMAFDVLDSRSISKNVSKGIIHSYKYADNQGVVKVFAPDEIFYAKYEDDTNDSNNGMGILTSVLYDAICDLESIKSNYSIYKNSARPDLLLMLDGNLTEEEQQIAKDVFEAQFSGSENAHKVIVGGGIQDIKTLSLTAQDMEYINQRNMTTSKVASAFGVPKSILGYTESVNYSNGENQKEEFLEGTIKPHEEDFESCLNKLMEMFCPKIWNNYRIKADSEQLKETQERYEGQRKDVQAGILTINEVRIDRGLEPMEEENANKLLISNGLGLLEDIVLDNDLNVEEQ